MGNVLAKQEQVIALGRLVGPYAGSRRRRESSRDSWRLLDVCRDSYTHSWRLGAEGSSKSGPFGDHRLYQFKTGQ